MALYFTGSETTRRESLADTIAVRTPMAIPMIARLPNQRVDHTITEWTLDEPFNDALTGGGASGAIRDIADPNKFARLEGAAYPASDSRIAPVRARAVCEIHARKIEVSDSDRSSVIAGMSNRLDYESGRMVTRHLNGVDNALHYGNGGFALTAADGTGLRKVQGIIPWAAWTGLERVHFPAGATAISDPYGVLIPRSMFSVGVDFENSNITGDSFYNNLIGRIGRAGGDLSVPWTWQCGRAVMGRVAKFLMTDSGQMVNERTVSAESAMGYDYLVTLRLPDGTLANFRVNHWLDAEGSTFAINNTVTPPAGGTAGAVNKTFQGNQTMIGHRPGSVRVGWYREPGFEADPYTDGDFSRLIVKSEFTLLVDHPLDVAFAGNVLA
jgi:hypothetical protein